MNSLKLTLSALALAMTATAMAEGPVETVVIPLFDAVAAEDLPTAASFLVEDATLHAMFNPSGETGTGSVRSFPAVGYFQLVTANYENIVFDNRSYSVADGGRTVWMEANGNLRLEANGSPYRNRYVFKLSLNEAGKVTEISEWVNTVTLTQQGIAANSD